MRRLAPNSIVLGNCIDLIPQLAPKSIRLVVTSPPYALQRKNQYGGIPEDQYPAWMAGLLHSLLPALTDDGSVMINIRPHLRKGEISDYVLRSRLAIREVGYQECEELIWFKPDGPPLGSPHRPRRTYESVHWFGKRGQKQFIDLTALGRPNHRPGFDGFDRFGKVDFIHGPKTRGRGTGKVKSRITDVIQCSLGQMAQEKVMHPAMFPLALPDFLIRSFSSTNDIVLDPFNGSGTTCIAAMHAGRRWIGMECDAKYHAESVRRLDKHRKLVAA
jgi:site-specific DNA-methyltransferase (adenine-specific)